MLPPIIVFLCCCVTQVNAALVTSPAIAEEAVEVAKARKLLKILDANKGKFPADFNRLLNIAIVLGSHSWTVVCPWTSSKSRYVDDT